MAEMSGRKRRMVKQPNGSYKYCLRSSGEVALEKVCMTYVMKPPASFTCKQLVLALPMWV